MISFRIWYTKLKERLIKNGLAIIQLKSNRLQ
jgi:hypothetical protein